MTRSALRRLLLPEQRGVAAQRLRERGAERVAILDVDAHHGNGAQAIFWERGDVRTGSVHVDPRAGWFPHVLGGPDERGAGAGEGANREPRCSRPGRATRTGSRRSPSSSRWAGACDALVVALGVDAAAARPGEPAARHARAATARPVGCSARSALPTVVVQEGGYELGSVGPLVRATPRGPARRPMSRRRDRRPRLSRGRIDGMIARSSDGRETR